jgi:hypothetical protein
METIGRRSGKVGRSCHNLVERPCHNLQSAWRPPPCCDAAAHTRVDRLADVKGTLLPVKLMAAVHCLRLDRRDACRGHGVSVRIGTLAHEVHGLGSFDED